jgi:acyl carrier protein
MDDEEPLEPGGKGHTLRIQLFKFHRQSLLSVYISVIGMPANDDVYQDGLGGDPVSRRVVDVICDQYNAETSLVYRNTSLVMDLYGDSMDHLELAMAIEDNFDDIKIATIPDDVINSWRTVGQVVDYVQSHAEK